MSPDRMRFDDFEIDVPALELSRNGEAVPLAPAAVRVLMYLGEHSGSLVSREALYSEFWPDGGVDAQRLLNTYVRQIRIALGERGGEDRFIRTYPRRGYRFLPPLIHGSAASPGGGAPTAFRAHLNGKRAAAGVAAVLAVAALTATFAPLVDDESGDPAGRLTGEARIQFLTGRELLSQPMPAVRASAVPHFRTVTRLVPDFAPAFTGLAESLVWTGRADAAEEAARAALALGSRDPHARMSLGTSLLVGKWAWRDAEAELRQAVDLGEDDPASHLSLAFLLINSGRADEARSHLDQATQLSPVSPDLTGDLGALYGWLGDHEAALELCRRTTQIEPRATWGYACALEAGRALSRSAVVAEASAALVGLDDTDPKGVFRPGTDIEGRIADLRRFQLDQAGANGTSHFRLAKIWLDLQDPALALDELERAAQGKEMGFVALLGEPRFRPLSSDVRFQQLVHRLFSGEPPSGVSS